MESEDELTFETGETIDVHTVPEEWRRLLTAIRIEANGFKHVLDWDASSFACLLSLVLLHYPGKKDAGTGEDTMRKGLEQLHYKDDANS